MLPSVNELALLSILSMRGEAREDTISVISSEVNMFSHQRSQLEGYHFPKYIYRLLTLYKHTHTHKPHNTHKHTPQSKHNFPDASLLPVLRQVPPTSLQLIYIGLLFLIFLPAFFFLPILFERGFHVSQTGLVLYVFEGDLKLIIPPASTY